MIIDWIFCLLGAFFYLFDLESLESFFQSIPLLRIAVAAL